MVSNLPLKLMLIVLFTFLIHGAAFGTITMMLKPEQVGQQEKISLNYQSFLEIYKQLSATEKRPFQKILQGRAQELQRGQSQTWTGEEYALFNSLTKNSGAEWRQKMQKSLQQFIRFSPNIKIQLAGIFNYAGPPSPSISSAPSGGKTAQTSSVGQNKPPPTQEDKMGSVQVVLDKNLNLENIKNLGISFPNKFILPFIPPSGGPSTRVPQPTIPPISRTVQTPTATNTPKPTTSWSSQSIKDQERGQWHK